MKNWFLANYFNDTATTENYTLSLHDALPISADPELHARALLGHHAGQPERHAEGRRVRAEGQRSEEHTSELQSRQYLVCRLLLEKYKYPFQKFVANSSLKSF